MRERARACDKERESARERERIRKEEREGETKKGRGGEREDIPSVVTNHRHWHKRGAGKKKRCREPPQTQITCNA